MSDGFTFDLSALADRLRDELRAELAATIRAETAASDWPEWLSVESASRYLDAPVERVRKLKDRREIPHYQEGPGCRVFFKRSELDAWMDGYRREAR